jgi:hypothetical protein
MASDDDMAHFKTWINNTTTGRNMLHQYYKQKSNDITNQIMSETIGVPIEKKVSPFTPKQAPKAQLSFQLVTRDTVDIVPIKYYVEEPIKVIFKVIHLSEILCYL